MRFSSIIELRSYVFRQTYLIWRQCSYDHQHSRPTVLRQPGEPNCLRISFLDTCVQEFLLYMRRQTGELWDV